VSVGFTPKDIERLEKLNRGSWDRTFTPEAAIDWQSATTTTAEYRKLYDAWSLLRGTAYERDLTEEQRVHFAAFQQANLMQFTAIFERFGLPNFENLFGDDDHPAYQEYVAHLIKEETYHYLLFARAVAKMRADHPGIPQPPRKHLDLYLAFVMFLMRLIPFRKIRHGMEFFFLRFAEEITLQANTMAKRTVGRADSLVSRVWELHALDEARHVAFDDLMMERARLPRPFTGVPRMIALPLCVVASLLLNLNEIWAARKLGVRVGYLALPGLLRGTMAPFKRKVFSILSRGFMPEDTTSPFTVHKMDSIETYMYGLKQRAHEHHCLVHGTFPVDVGKLSALRKTYSKRVRPVTLLPFFVKAVALSIEATPGINRILFKKWPWGKRIVRFNVIDVNLPITREVHGEMVTFVGTLRGVNKMTVGQVQDELEKLQRGPPEDSPYIQKLVKLKSAPPIAARIFHWLMTRSPKFYLKNAGTCSLTTLDGMKGDHFFSVGPTTSLFCIGGIGDEPVVRDGKVVPARIAKIALALDNYVVSGLDGVLVARKFQELLESCSFVEEELARAPDAPPAHVNAPVAAVNVGTEGSA
jgi:hypothetical protein